MKYSKLLKLFKESGRILTYVVRGNKVVSDGRGYYFTDISEDVPTDIFLKIIGANEKQIGEIEITDHDSSVEMPLFEFETKASEVIETRGSIDISCYGSNLITIRHDGTVFLIDRDAIAPVQDAKELRLFLRYDSYNCPYIAAFDGFFPIAVVYPYKPPSFLVESLMNIKRDKLYIGEEDAAKADC